MRITNAQKIKLGLFVIITAILLVTALYVIGRKQNIFGGTSYISAIFTNVNGLKLGNNVRYSGINVGTVRKITMINDTTICVNMAVESDILEHIRKDAKAVIGSDGIVGSMVLNIFPGTVEADLLRPGDTLSSIRKISTSDMMSTLSVTNQNAAELSSELLKITSSLNEGQGTLGRLLNDEEMGNDLKETVRNLNKVSREASEVINDLKTVISDIEFEESLLYVLVNDSLAASQFRSTLTHLETSSEQIEEAVENLNSVILEVKEGDGTFNYIVNDTTLVNDIDETVKNVKQGSVLLNENLEAMRHNFLFKGYFKKMEKEEKKAAKKAKKNE
jgi:phospholipid/cholesterol/gamma-HCH transport system substrate-binding protein